RIALRSSRARQWCSTTWPPQGNLGLLRRQSDEFSKSCFDGGAGRVRHNAHPDSWRCARSHHERGDDVLSSEPSKPCRRDPCPASGFADGAMRRCARLTKTTWSSTRTRARRGRPPVLEIPSGGGG